jgi:membrane-associated protease RseP (regulator of RpoE activity)
MALKCPQCNAATTETQRFCRYCGYRLDQSVQDYVATETLDRQTQPASYYTPPPWMTPTPIANETARMSHGGRRRHGLRYGIWIAIGLLSASAVIGGIVVNRISDRRAPPAIAATPTSYMGVGLEDADGGALIEEVYNGTPADQSGLIGGDVVIEANGAPVRSERELRRVLRSTPPRTELRLKILRDGQPVELVMLTGIESDFRGGGPDGPVGFFGIDDNGERVRVPGKELWGVQLNDVRSNDPADLAGIKNGDIIIEFNGHPIRVPNELSRRIRQTAPYTTVTVKVMRDGQELVIPVKMGMND